MKEKGKKKEGETKKKRKEKGRFAKIIICENNTMHTYTLTRRASQSVSLANVEELIPESRAI